MTPEERELRRALGARSVAPSPEFRARLGAALDQARPTANLTQVIALVAAFAATVTTVGVLLYARHALAPVGHGGPASAARLTSPSPPPAGQAPFYQPGAAQVSAPTPGVVWVLFGNTKLYLSTDQGITWRQRATPPGAPVIPTEISFIDIREGWYLQGGAGGTQCSFGPVSVWHTTDAGGTWQRIVLVDLGAGDASSARTSAAFIGIRGDQCKQGLSFVDRTHGFIEAWDDNSPPTIYRTSDGGSSWSASTLPDPPGFKTYGAGDALRAQPVQRFGSTLLLAAYGMQPDGEHGYVFQSTDGGTTWGYLATLPTIANAVTMVTQTRWLIIFAGHSLETLDEGKTWHAFASDYDQPADVPPDIAFADSLIGYSLVDTGLSKTINGGAHWVALKTPGS